MSALSREDYNRLPPYLREVDLSQGEVLYEQDTLIETAYFPCQAMVSLVQVMEDGSTIEAGIVGKDGIVGYATFLGGNFSNSRAIVQIPGKALAISAGVLKAEFDRREGLHKLLLLYLEVLLSQISQTAACNRFHSTEQRLARWLLQSQDLVVI